MNQYPLVQILPFIAWFVVIIEFILGMYALILNAWHTANRHTFVLLTVIALNGFALGTMASATTVTGATPSMALLAITTPAIAPLLLVESVALMRPGWLGGRRRWLWWPVYLIAFVPAVIIASDLWLGTNIWYIGLEPTTYSGGFVMLSQFTAGRISQIIYPLTSIVFTCLTLTLLLYFAFSRNKAARVSRKLTWLLITGILSASFIQVYLVQFIDPGVATLVTGACLATVYGYTCVALMIAERRIQRGSLQLRLTALILTISIPLMISITVFVISRAGKLLEAYALNTLRTSNHLYTVQLNLWLDANGKAIQALTDQPDIISMDPMRQKPVLQAMAATYPYMFLVSTTDLDGMNIARSDTGSLQNYNGTTWFENAKAGNPLSYVTVPINASGSPTLVVSSPIHRANGQVVGVGMLTTNLEILNRLVQTDPIGMRGLAYVLNDKNQIVSSSDPSQKDVLNTLQTLLPASETGLVEEQTLGISGPATSTVNEEMLSFKDLNGSNWRAYSSSLENNWRVIVLLPESELMAYVRLFEQVSWIVLGLGSMLLLGLSWLTIRQGIRPVRALTDTATSIAAGDLTRVAPVESDDEIGLLARAFNSMTGQIREMIANLEKRVTDRTRDLERRAVQLQVTAEVASQAAAIRDQDQLLDLTVQLISDRFNFYHAGLFLIDEAGKYAVLRAASSPGGQRMLARKHKLEVGKVGIVGYVAEAAKPRIALDVGEDAVFFNNPDLPQTRSEMALPLSVRGEVIGVLDVQSTKPSAFTDEDTAILQILADQVALAIDNTRLLAETQQTLQELKSLYELQVGQAWQKRLGNQKIAYTYTSTGVSPSNLKDIIPIDEGENTFSVPVVFRGQPLGSLVLRREKDHPNWSMEEVEVVNNIATQIGLALENVRLLEETQRRVEHERQIAEITAKLRASNDPETIVKTAAEELQRALRVSKAQVLLHTDQPTPDKKPGNGNGHDLSS